MVLAYVDYEYFVQTFCWVFQPPIRIAIDTVTIVSLGIIFNVLSFAHIIATSRTYIVSTMGSTEVGQPFLMVCSTKPIRTTAGGAFQLESAIFRWPHILIFPLLPGEERMQFESLRRGEIPPDLENQEPDDEE